MNTRITVFCHEYRTREILLVIPAEGKDAEGKTFKLDSYQVSFEELCKLCHLYGNYQDYRMTLYKRGNTEITDEDEYHFPEKDLVFTPFESDAEGDFDWIVNILPEKDARPPEVDAA